MNLLVFLIITAVAVSHQYIQNVSSITTNFRDSQLIVSVTNDLGPTVWSVDWSNGVSFQITWWGADSGSLSQVQQGQPTQPTINGKKVDLSLVGASSIPTSVLGAWCTRPQGGLVQGYFDICQPYDFTPSSSYANPSSSYGAVLLVRVPQDAIICVNGYCGSAIQWSPSTGLKRENLQDLGNGIVYDTIQGLMWQKDIEAAQFSYTAGSTDFTNINAAEGHCNSMGLGGYNRWRLPTHLELMRIMDYTIANPAMNTTVFPDPSGYVSASNFWTITHVRISDYTADFLFIAGSDGSVSTSTDAWGPYRVRCTHTVINRLETYGGTRYVVNSNATAVDLSTGLTWMRWPKYDVNYAAESDPGTAASNFCQSYSVDRQSGWRLPSNLEWNSLWDSHWNGQQHGPTWNQTVFNAKTWVDNSDPNAGAWMMCSNHDVRYGTWWVFNGGFLTYTMATDTAYLRCVRGPDNSIYGGANYPYIFTNPAPPVAAVTTGDLLSLTSADLTPPDVTTQDPVASDLTTQSLLDLTTQTLPDVTTQSPSDLTTQSLPDLTTQQPYTPDLTTQAPSPITTGYVQATTGRLRGRAINVTLIHVRIAADNISSDDLSTAMLSATSQPKSSRYRMVVYSSVPVPTVRSVDASIYIAPSNNSKDPSSSKLTTALFKKITDNPSTALPGFNVTQAPTMSYAIIDVPDSSTTSVVATTSDSVLLGQSTGVLAGILVAIIVVIIVIVVTVVVLVRRRRNSVSGASNSELSAYKVENDAMYMNAPPSGSNPLHKESGNNLVPTHTPRTVVPLESIPMRTMNSDKFAVGSRCEALWADDGQYYSARIDEVRGGKYYITYTDFGTTACLNRNDLR